MTEIADTQAPLEAVLKDEILRMYQAVADQPESTFHFFHGREAAELFGYEAEWLDRAPAGAVASFSHVRETTSPRCDDWDAVGGPRGRSAVVPRFRFRKGATQEVAEAYGVKAVMMTALKPTGS